MTIVLSSVSTPVCVNVIVLVEVSTEHEIFVADPSIVFVVHADV